MKTYKSEKYFISASDALTAGDIEMLTSLFKKQAMPKAGPLAGRGKVYTCRTETGNAVVRQYRRGGMARHISESRYLRTGITRSEAEFRLLNRLAGSGINAPEPLAWAVQGGFFYRCWLVMRKIKGAETLAEIALREDPRLVPLLAKTVEQIRLLIKHRIYHVDLHPGNVLVNESGVHIIDFDKARFTNLPEKFLAFRYRKRWLRAAEKYNLPQNVSTHVADHI